MHHNPLLLPLSLSLGQSRCTKQTIHSTKPLFRGALGTGTLRAVVDIDTDFGPCFDELGFAVAGQLSFLCRVAGEDAAEEVALDTRRDRVDSAGLVSRGVAKVLTRRL